MKRPAVTAGICCWLVVLSACGHRAAPPSTSPAPQTGTARDSVLPSGNRAGSIDSLSAGTLQGRHVQDIAELLQGRVAGLQVVRLPNGDISLRIRGGDLSLDSSNGGAQEVEPLLVINGMPVADAEVSNTLRGLDPHDIANIQVLKDVSSTSVYGIRGAHGVILITLKRQ
ncbi:MAG TPA: TonB-dependent receptor plug domain-containing protein [Gemmatimonadaceae bacterium]|nr:TonB-dependent receptor plug domain-containing protein [Gemmatimonadaceae bacterium]